jgi:hypothetical protein
VIGTIGSWLLFTIPGALGINSFGETRDIVDDVTRTLAYKYPFYLSLPWLTLLSRPPVSARWLAASACVFVPCLLVFNPLPTLLNPPTFGSGMAVAPLGPAVAAAFTCLALAFADFPGVAGYLQLAFLTAFFLPGARGNRLAGLLQRRGSRARRAGARHSPPAQHPALPRLRLAYQPRGGDEVASGSCADGGGHHARARRRACTGPTSKSRGSP